MSVSWTYENQDTDMQKNILFIGNSVTIHPIMDYWFGEWGMAATDADHDYAHVYSAMVSKDYDVNATACNFAQWETLWYDRGETLILLDGIVEQKDWDEIIIQLRENVSDASTFENDLKELAKYVNKDATEIIIVGNFWKEELGLEEMKKTVASDIGAKFVSLNDLQEIAAYQLGENTEVSSVDGQMYTPNHDVVARHPGNPGMQEIAS